ncbi:metallophosphoesterase family protein [Pseudomonadota bacterium]
MKSFVKKWLGDPEPAGERSIPRVEAGHRIYSIGDIHGRFDLLQELHRMIAEDAANFEGGKTLVYLGDYIDRGLWSREVIDDLLESPLNGFESVYLLGNHEQTLLDFLEQPKIAAGWLSWGGRETLVSYGVDLPLNISREKLAAIRDEFEGRLPVEHLEFFRNMQLMHVSGDYLFVHAGIRPGKPIQEQSNADLLWIREDFTESRMQHDFVVVHGHTISEEVVFRPNRIGIDTGAYATGVLTCLVLEGEERRLLQTGGEQ